MEYSIEFNGTSKLKYRITYTDLNGKTGVLLDSYSIDVSATGFDDVEYTTVSTPEQEEPHITTMPSTEPNNPSNDGIIARLLAIFGIAATLYSVGEAC